MIKKIRNDVIEILLGWTGELIEGEWEIIRIKVNARDGREAAADTESQSNGRKPVLWGKVSFFMKQCGKRWLYAQII